MTTSSSACPRVEAPAGARPGRTVRRRTPATLRILALATVLTAAAATALVTAAVHTSWRALSRTERPTAVLLSAADLSAALSDLDNQLVAVLLVGGRQDLAVTRQQALLGYEQRRSEVARHLQRVASAADADPTVPHAVRTLLDDLGRYQALAADAIQLSAGPAAQPAAQPGAVPPAALARYRDATDLMHAALLPTVDDLMRAHDWTATDHFLDLIDPAERAFMALIIGTPTLLLLLALQVFLARRVRRTFNPALVAATLVLLSTAGAVAPALDGYRYLGSEDQFRASGLVARARAVSHEAHADQRRYLLDPEHAARYEQRFLATAHDLVPVGAWDRTNFTPAGIDGYDNGLARYLAVDPTDRTYGCPGYLPSARCSLEFVSGPVRQRLPTWASVDRTLPPYQAYQLTDRRIRALVRDGKRDEAIRQAIGPAPDGSSAAFERYDRALVDAIDANRAALRRTIAADKRGDVRTMATAAGVCVLVAFFVVTGARRRLAEFR